MHHHAHANCKVEKLLAQILIVFIHDLLFSVETKFFSEQKEMLNIYLTWVERIKPFYMLSHTFPHITHLQ